MIRKVPVPTAGVMLGLAALGNLLAPYSMVLKYICGICAAFLGILLFSKVILHPKMIKNDLMVIRFLLVYLLHFLWRLCNFVLIQFRLHRQSARLFGMGRL